MSLTHFPGLANSGADVAGPSRISNLAHPIGLAHNSPSELNILKLVQYIASNGRSNGSMLTTDSGF